MWSSRSSLLTNHGHHGHRLLSDESHNAAEIETSIEEQHFFASLDKLPFYRRLLVLNDRQILWTQENRIGFTIPGARPGDVVCVINRATIPHASRKVEGVGGEVQRWRFVGDGIIHGLMSREVDEMDVEDSDILLV